MTRDVSLTGNLSAGWVLRPSVLPGGSVGKGKKNSLQLSER